MIYLEPEIKNAKLIIYWPENLDKPFIDILIDYTTLYILKGFYTWSITSQFSLFLNFDFKNFQKISTF